MTDETPTVSQDNLLGQLKAKRQEIAEKAQRNLYLAVPGYDDLLWLKFKRVPWEEVNKIATKAAKRAGKVTTAELDAACDLMIRACAGVYVKPDGVLEPQPYDEGFTVELAEKLGIQATTAREVVRGLYADDYALVNQNNELTEWLRGANVEDLGRFEGE